MNLNFRSDREVVATFMEETAAHALEIENGLLSIEKNGFSYSDDLVNGMFRSAHSIKAGASLLDLHPVEKLAHRMENVLQLLRKRDINPDEQTVTVLLQVIDTIRDLSEDLDAAERIDISGQLAKLERLIPEKGK
jgi:two-component system chemotaxis sensor kinase CheA